VVSELYLKVREFLARATDREEGQGMVEYALILVLIAVVVIVILSVLGGQVKNVFSNVSSGLNQ
jgi:pilus assembly protein Flp/PilA